MGDDLYTVTVYVNYDVCLQMCMHEVCSMLNHYS